MKWLELFGHPAAQSGLMDMRSLNSLVTDSSAASSSWGSGVRIINGMVNQQGDRTPLTTLYELFGQQGWARGLVTTTEITHATPAGFATCVDNRDKATTIAAQYYDRRVEILLGGGRKFFDPKHRKDKRDLRGDFATAGYCVMNTVDDLQRAPLDRPWLGTFSKSHLPFVIDHPNDPTSALVPSLAAMTAAALKKLEREPHFILQVEGGRVDHAAHNSDAVSAMHEMISFDEALEVCLEFQKRVPDTLLVVTTDHGNANIGLNGTGDGYGQSLWNFKKVANVNASFPEILKRMRITDPPDPKKVDEEKDDEADKKKEAAKSKEEKDREAAEKKKKDENVVSPKEIAAVIYELTGYKPSERRAGLLRPYVQKKGDPLYEMMKSDVCALGQLMGNYHALGFIGNAHTSDYVSILALGPGAEKFAGFIPNTDVFHRYLEFAKIDFRNPQEHLIAGAPYPHTPEDTEAYRIV